MSNERCVSFDGTQTESHTDKLQPDWTRDRHVRKITGKKRGIESLPSLETHHRLGQQLCLMRHLALDAWLLASHKVHDVLKNVLEPRFAGQPFLDTLSLGLHLCKLFGAHTITDAAQ